MHGTVHSIENSVKPLLTCIKQLTNYYLTLLTRSSIADYHHQMTLKQ